MMAEKYFFLGMQYNFALVDSISYFQFFAVIKTKRKAVQKNDNNWVFRDIGKPEYRLIYNHFVCTLIPEE